MRLAVRGSSSASGSPPTFASMLIGPAEESRCHHSLRPAQGRKWLPGDQLRAQIVDPYGGTCWLSARDAPIGAHSRQLDDDTSVAALCVVSRSADRQLGMLDAALGEGLIAPPEPRHVPLHVEQELSDSPAVGVVEADTGSPDRAVRVFLVEAQRVVDVLVAESRRTAPTATNAGRQAGEVGSRRRCGVGGLVVDPGEVTEVGASAEGVRLPAPDRQAVQPAGRRPLAVAEDGASRTWNAMGWPPRSRAISATDDRQAAGGAQRVDADEGRVDAEVVGLVTVVICAGGPMSREGGGRLIGYGRGVRDRNSDG